MNRLKGRTGRVCWRRWRGSWLSGGGCLLPRMSYRGRVLIINNLVASTLWHRLKCLEPPAGLLQKVQTVILNFFWHKLHWVPQCVLYLPKEEGGQGLVHLGSRAAAFRLHFIQRYLLGHDDVVWRQVTGIILRKMAGLSLDKPLSSLFFFVCVVCLLFIMVFSKHGLYLNGTDWGPLCLCSGSWRSPWCAGLS